MNSITLTLSNDSGCYLPSDAVACEVEWALDATPRSIEARLFWYTRGKGTTDTYVAAAHPLDCLAAGSAHFTLAVPTDAVLSYHGRLMSVIWAIEVVAEKKLGFARREITVSPTGAALCPPDDR